MTRISHPNISAICQTITSVAALFVVVETMNEKNRFECVKRINGVFDVAQWRSDAWRVHGFWIPTTTYPGTYMLISCSVVLWLQFHNSAIIFFPRSSCVDRFFLHKLYIMICCRYLMHEYRMEKKNSAQRICYVDHGYVVNIFIISGAECRLLVSVWYVCALT